MRRYRGSWSPFVYLRSSWCDIGQPESNIIACVLRSPVVWVRTSNFRKGPTRTCDEVVQKLLKIEFKLSHDLLRRYATCERLCLKYLSFGRVWLHDSLTKLRPKRVTHRLRNRRTRRHGRAADLGSQLTGTKRAKQLLSDPSLLAATMPCQDEYFDTPAARATKQSTAVLTGRNLMLRVPHDAGGLN